MEMMSPTVDVTDDDVANDDGEGAFRGCEMTRRGGRYSPADSLVIPGVDHVHSDWGLQRRHGKGQTEPHEGTPLGYRQTGFVSLAAASLLIIHLLPPGLMFPRLRCRLRRELVLLLPLPDMRSGRVQRLVPQDTPGYCRVDHLVEIVEAMIEIAPTTLEGVDQRVTELDTTVRQRTEEFQVRFEEAYDDRACTWVDNCQTLTEDRPTTATQLVALWIEGHTQLIQCRSIATLEARDPEPQDGPAEAGSSFVYLTVDENVPQKNHVDKHQPPQPILHNVTNAQLQALIDQGVVAALAERDASRSRDGDNSHGSGTAEGRQVHTQRECITSGFLKCKPIDFKALEMLIMHLVPFKECLDVLETARRGYPGQDVMLYTFAMEASEKDDNRINMLGARSKSWNPRVLELKRRSTDLRLTIYRFQELALSDQSLSQCKEELNFATVFDGQNDALLRLNVPNAENKRQFEEDSRNNQNQHTTIQRNIVAWR
ncbi:hypothetical protein Tco_0116648 [Tanacetum coccineum]